MRVRQPRIPPVQEREWTATQREMLEPLKQRGLLINVFTTMARNPPLLQQTIDTGLYFYEGSTLSPRDRELLILRVSWLCRSEYEWASHVPRAKQAGLTDHDIIRVTHGPEAEGWSSMVRLLLQAVDELHAEAFITDATWKALTQQYTEPQLMDLVGTVGQYTLGAMMLNSFGVQLDEQFQQNRFPPTNSS
ncbi:MAG: carboxymuconolactone decarboxylase family protein [Candidatus Hermodarchaeia archaeon]